eukprot:TRINITY_DN12444_c2_g1_i1.p1 TRINITY_DN12444_c2_g1~~TRINITY_DN12444_c2_g1_i1.p1  ORF type:complete len:264 (+),score=80.41 TRINITY_DN12444_c2_g1_i1:57-794(+)
MKTFVIAASMLLTVAAQQNNTQHACWKKSHPRGVGKPLDACAPGLVKDAALCYVPCQANYTGDGPVCWENCPPGWHNTGATCMIPEKIISANNTACPWYDECGLTFAKGCSTCPPNEGYHNDGCTCRRPMKSFAKKSYGRGVGKPMVCKPDEQEQGALCYKLCPNGSIGDGPVCWDPCPATNPVHCAGTMCGVPGFDCSEEVKNDLGDLLKDIVACSTPDNLKACLDDIAKTAKTFAMDGICPGP